MKKIFLLLWILVGLYGLSQANNFGSSYSGKEASVTFIHTSALDSAWAVFGYDGDASGLDSAQFYDSLKLLPAFSGDGMLLWADGLKLDSIGVHVVKIRGYTGDAIATMTVGIWENKNLDADVVKISGDATAANNLETMLDGTGGQVLTLAQLRINATSANGAIDIDNSGGAGIKINLSVANGSAIDITGAGNGAGIYAVGGSSGSGFHGVGSGTGAGMKLQGGGNGLYVMGAASYDGAFFYGGASGGHGINTQGQAAGHGLYAVAGASGYDINADIHGTIDSCAGPAYVIDVADTVNAILDTIQAHAPHGDDWSGSGAAGADTSDIKAMIQKNWDSDTDGELTVEPHGTGTRTVVIQCLDYTDSTTGISSVMIDVYDSTAGEYKMTLQSNTAGLCTLSLDDGRYAIHLKKTADAISGGSPQYRGVASDTTHTFYVDQFDPGAPPSADLCRVWCLVPNLSSDWLAGCKLSIYVPRKFRPLVYEGTIISHYTISATSNDTGFVYIDIYEMEGANRIKCNADTTKTVKANIELRNPTGGLIGKTYKAIPDATDWEIIW